ncbi:IS3 family transposase, partial [Burkholderia glumae AU6208]
MKYAWIDEHRDPYSVTRPCRLPFVPPPGSFPVLLRPPAPRPPA